MVLDVGVDELAEGTALRCLPPFLQRVLAILDRDQVRERLDVLGQRLEEGIVEIARQGPQIQCQRLGSLFWLCFADGELPRSAEAIDAKAAQQYAPFFGACLAQGVYLAPSAYEVGFLSSAHTEADIDKALTVFQNSLNTSTA